MSTTIKSIALAAATAFAVLGGVGAAEAGGKHHGFKFHKFNNFHSFNHGPRFRVVIGGGCGYLYDRWMFTGSRYWKHRYLECRYGY